MPLAFIKESAARSAGEPAGRMDAASHLVLYVEDNPANLKLVEEIVRFRPDLRLIAAAACCGVS